ncbi:MAG: Re/Si-specific NAD(P)(+) transhydrogenase subunit alpha [Thermoanaerobaculia bacterium]|nr:Re/Si-specific NAD(P)(+) transhydrogenase subunit alpha [Thermoanaerobaculia bacterium]
MKVLIANESHSGEPRVAATPETVKKMIGAGLEVAVEAGAGHLSSFEDETYRDAGASVEPATAASRQTAGALLKVNRLGEHPELGEEVALLAEGALVIGFLEPWDNIELARRLVERRITALAMELVPRISRAQSMDALSSQASVGGYKAVLLAASRLPRYFPLLMTAAGTIRPARVVIMGAGVAGLQAIATAKRLGAVVEVSDIRPAVAEQVRSLGGRFIDLPEIEQAEDAGGYAREMGEEFLRRQREILTEHVAAANVVITTAAVPGKPAPRLLTADMVRRMHPGSVVVDLAAERGGNCELTRPGEEVVENGVLILGPINLPGSVPHDASTLYSRNVLNLLEEMLEEGAAKVDLDNDVIGPTLVTHDGRVMFEPLARQIEGVVA